MTRRLERLGLRMVADRDFELVDPNGDPRFDLYWKTYHGLVERKASRPMPPARWCARAPRSLPP